MANYPDQCKHYIVIKQRAYLSQFFNCHRWEPRHSVHEHRLDDDETIRWKTGSLNDRGPE